MVGAGWLDRRGALHGAAGRDRGCRYRDGHTSHARTSAARAEDVHRDEVLDTVDDEVHRARLDGTSGDGRSELVETTAEDHAIAVHRAHHDGGRQVDQGHPTVWDGADLPAAIEGVEDVHHDRDVRAAARQVERECRRAGEEELPRLADRVALGGHGDECCSGGLGWREPELAALAILGKGKRAGDDVDPAPEHVRIGRVALVVVPAVREALAKTRSSRELHACSYCRIIGRGQHEPIPRLRRPDEQAAVQGQVGRVDRGRVDLVVELVVHFDQVDGHSLRSDGRTAAAAGQTQSPRKGHEADTDCEHPSCERAMRTQGRSLTSVVRTPYGAEFRTPSKAWTACRLEPQGPYATEIPLG